MKRIITQLKHFVVLAIVLCSSQVFAQLSCYQLVGYYTSWGAMTPAQIDYSRFTHINYSFGIPSADGTIAPIENSGRLVDLVTRAHNNNTKVLLAIGGWMSSSPTSTPFETFSVDAAGRDRFINNVVNLINQYNLDGIDIDWEYPTAPSKWEALMVPLANRIHGMGKLLTAAVAGSNWFGQGFGSVSMLDLVNIMAYDCACPTNSPYQFAVDANNYWAGKGVPQNKRIIGIPFYSEDNINSLHVQKANYAKANAGGIMIWEIGGAGDVAAIHNTLGTLCKGTTPPPPPPCTVVSLPGTIQAESYCTMSGVQNEPTTDTNGGQNVGYIEANDWMDYRVNVTQAGSYTVNFRVASQPGGGQLQLRSGAAVLATVNIGATGGWQSWTTLPATVNLNAGTQTLRIHASAGGFNLNWVQFTTGGGNNTPPTVSLTGPANGASFTAPASITITANASDAAPGTVSSVAFYNGSTLLGTDTSSPYSFTWSNVGAGTYTITARATDNQGASTTSAAHTITVNGTGGCSTTPAWTASGVYTQGNRVSRNGNIYEAKWWTQNEDPITASCQWCVWKLIGACAARVASADIASNEAISEEDGSSFAVYPNAIVQGGKLNIDLHRTYENIQITLIEGNVKNAYKYTYKNQRYVQIDVPSLPRGMVILKVVADKKTLTTKLVSQ